MANSCENSWATRISPKPAGSGTSRRHNNSRPRFDPKGSSSWLHLSRPIAASAKSSKGKTRSWKSMFTPPRFAGRKLTSSPTSSRHNTTFLISIRPTFPSRAVFKRFCRQDQQETHSLATVHRSELVSRSDQNPFDDLAFLRRANQSLVQPLERIGELMRV